MTIALALGLCLAGLVLVIWSAERLVEGVVGTSVALATLLIRLITRIAVLPLVAIMLTAITTTKLLILLGGSHGPLHVQGLAHSGFWAMAHESRTDWSMLLGSFPAGRWERPSVPRWSGGAPAPSQRWDRAVVA